MASFNTQIHGYISVNWFIENFQFCWHKTAERLESPLFHIDFSSRTSWRFWLYPRGKDDGENLSIYLFREEGGQEEVEVEEFQILLFTSLSETELAEKTLRRCSFKIHQKEGCKYFVARSEISHLKIDELHFVCILWTRERIGGDNSERYLLTRIRRERIYGTEILDDGTNLDSIFIKDIDVKPMLEEEPLINLSISYVSDSLVIKIRPVNCREIKFAVCKITVIKNWGCESPIEHVRSWIGEIKADSWRYYLLPETISSQLDFASSSCKAFVFHYDFAFSTGKTMVKWESREFGRYVEMMNVPVSQYFNVNIKTAKSALDALEEIYWSQSFADFLVEIGTSIFPVHQAIFATRSPELKLALRENIKININLNDIDCLKKVLLFFYSDTIKIDSFRNALSFYKLAFSFHLEPLKIHCRCFFKKCFINKDAVFILNLAYRYEDLSLKNEVKEYIVTNYESVIFSTNWDDYETEVEFRKEALLLKYKKQDRTQCFVKY